MECLFCKIIRKEVGADIVYENEKVLVFKDIRPVYSTHFLIVPKRHIESIRSEGSEEAVKVLVATAKQIAEEKKIPGFKLVFNVGRAGGQIVDHLHMHFLAGQPLKTLP